MDLTRIARRTTWTLFTAQSLGSAALIAIATVSTIVAAELTGDRRLGLLAAAFLAVSYWHVHFSRYGIRAILAPLWSAAAVLAWWRSVVPASARLGAGSPFSLSIALKTGMSEVTEACSTDPAPFLCIPISR